MRPDTDRAPWAAWHHGVVRVRTITSIAAVTGVAAIGYASVIERNWFALREQEVPVLPPGASPLRVLHISDTHLTPGRHRLMAFIRSLASLAPDLVVNTGDSIASPEALSPLLDSLGPLLDVPGVFVYGSNDLFSPKPRNPARYLWRTSAGEHEKYEPDLPWEKLGEELTAAGWLDLNNRRGELTVNGLNIALAGVHDPHADRDRYDLVAGQANATADLRLGVMHSPEPPVLDQFTADGYELLLAGHTHGGQLRVPGFGALVTNCGIDRGRVSGLSLHPQVSPTDGKSSWLHVSAGLGTSPWAPVRFACRPEATLLTLTPRAA
ncbi:metallophosphoesterase [Trebonia kvetii]|uniref:Metallophosphoesterase n=1 Tax=Trebonia kvetii TaxID=2480626 RepID=A0A6P2BMD0_9ACTN|nr:metallophosphoesterase [Trebonia kvetii]